jgi:hypothetical protein
MLGGINRSFKMKIKISKSQWEEMGKKAQYSFAPGMSQTDSEKYMSESQDLIRQLGKNLKDPNVVEQLYQRATKNVQNNPAVMDAYNAAKYGLTMDQYNQGAKEQASKNKPQPQQPQQAQQAQQAQPVIPQQPQAQQSQQARDMAQRGQQQYEAKQKAQQAQQPAQKAANKSKGDNMKYASQFNEIIVLAEKEKTKKKGGSMAAILKLVQELAEFESNIQEAMDAQEMTENRGQIEGFLVDIDKMYEVLLSMAKASIQAMRTERSLPVMDEAEGQLDAPPAPATIEPEVEPKADTKFSIDDLKKQLDTKPSAPISLTIPKAPK